MTHNRLIACTLLLLVLFLLTQCKRTRPNMHVQNREQVVSQIEASSGPDIDSSDYWLEAIPLSHEWLPEDQIGHLFGRPSNSTLNRWKQKCEEVTLEDVTRRQISCYSGERHFLAVYDLYHLVGEEEPEINEFVVWRLAQIAGNNTVPVAINEKMELLKNQIDSLLRFETASQMEMNMRAELKDFLYNSYNQLLSKYVAKEIGGNLADIIIKESTLAQQYHKSFKEAYEELCVERPMPGSAIPVAIGESGADDAIIIRNALESWLGKVSDYSNETSEGSTLQETLSEYDLFSNVQREVNYLTSLDIRRAALEKEKQAWKRWISYRNQVSSSLPDYIYPTFETATKSACRRKLINLKNRYNGYGYQGDIYKILKEDCTDQQLTDFIFEKINGYQESIE